MLIQGHYRCLESLAGPNGCNFILTVDNTKQVIKRFGRRVRALRKSNGWSQEDFAAHANLDRGYMGRIERGETNITIRNIVRIASALSADIADLFTDE